MNTRMLELMERSSEILSAQLDEFSELLNDNQNEMKTLGLINEDSKVDCKITDLKNYFIMKYGKNIGQILTLSCMYYQVMSDIHEIEKN